MWTMPQVAKLRGRWAGEPERRPKTHVHRSHSARAQCSCRSRLSGQRRGESWVGALAENFPHTRYWRDRSDCWSLKSLNALAAKIIDARYDGNEIEEVMEAEFPPAEFGQTWYHEVAPQLRSNLTDAGLDDDDDEIDAIRYAWEGPGRRA
jgi:hypothetical protein